MLKIEYTGETEGVTGTFDGSIHINVNPTLCDKNTEEEILSAYRELIAFFNFKNSEKASTPTRKTKKCNVEKNITAKQQETSEINGATAPVIITEGCNKGKTFEEVYEKEGSRAILFIAQNAKAPELRQAAEGYLKEQGSDL